MLTQENNDVLKKCDTEIKKSISSIKNVLNAIQCPDFKLLLIDIKDKLKEYKDEIECQLIQTNTSEKENSKMTGVISKVVIKTKLILKKTDKHAASLIFDECNKCIKSLNKALNENNHADTEINSLLNKIIQLMTGLRENLMQYL